MEATSKNVEAPPPPTINDSESTRMLQDDARKLIALKTSRLERLDALANKIHSTMLATQHAPADDSNPLLEAWVSCLELIQTERSRLKTLIGQETTLLQSIIDKQQPAIVLLDNTFQEEEERFKSVMDKLNTILKATIQEENREQKAQSQPAGACPIQHRLAMTQQTTSRRQRNDSEDSFQPHREHLTPEASPISIYYDPYLGKWYHNRTQRSLSVSSPPYSLKDLSNTNDEFSEGTDVATSATDNLSTATSRRADLEYPPFHSIQVSTPHTARSANILATYTAYVVVAFFNDGKQLEAARRYSDFQVLQRVLCKQYPALKAVLPQLPEKKVLGKFKKDFLEKRRAGLESFMQAIVENQRSYRFLPRYLHQFMSEFL